MLRSSLASFLLLCLLRTLLPEAWVVAWHPHQHTTHEPAFAPRPAAASKLLLSARHQHCHAEQFYNVPFVAAVPIVLPPPHRQPRYCPVAVAPTLPSQSAATGDTPLRGPPACQTRLGQQGRS